MESWNPSSTDLIILSCLEGIQIHSFGIYHKHKKALNFFLHQSSSILKDSISIFCILLFHASSASRSSTLFWFALNLVSHLLHLHLDLLHLFWFLISRLSHEQSQQLPFHLRRRYTYHCPAWKIFSVVVAVAVTEIFSIAVTDLRRRWWGFRWSRRWWGFRWSKC